MTNKTGNELPESINRNAPKLTFEMPGPLGAYVRQREASIAFSKDHGKSNSARALNYIDDKKQSSLVSSKDVNNNRNLAPMKLGKGPLSKEFEKAAKGPER